MRNILLVVALVSAMAACGMEPDERPPTAQYLVPAIFKPSCGTAACHSTATARSELVLDTIPGVCRASSIADGKGPLTVWLVSPAPDDNRMPLDSPLPDADIALLTRWYFPDGETPAVPPEGCP